MAEQPAWQPQCTAIYPEAPPGDQRCVQPEGHQPVVELHYNRAGFGWSDKEVLTASVIDARERLARHLYARSRYGGVGPAWEDISEGGRDVYRLQGTELLAVITGKED